MAELDRMVTAFTWGTAIAFDSKGRTLQKWNRLRARGKGASVGMSGKELETAVLGIAALDPSLVKIQQGAG